MKKIIILAVAIFASLGLRAQQMDTIHWGNPYYYWDAFLNPDSVDLNDYLAPVDTTSGGELIVIDSNATLFEQGGHIYIIIGTDTLDYNDPRLTWIDDRTAVLGGTLVVISSGTPGPIGILSPDGAVILRREYYDLLGRSKVDFQSLPRGVYIERTVTTQGVSTRKILRQ